LLEVKHNQRGESKFVESAPENVISETPIALEEVLSENVEEELSDVGFEEPIVPEIQEEVVVEAESSKEENLKQTSVTKLSEGLTLNDRYLFANELCNKDMNAFNELVKLIDNCSSLDEATKLYSTMDWEIDNEHVVTFTNLVERRFS
jgi:hypothetical protein